MPSVADLRGLWHRSLLVLPDGGRDTATQVRWMQGQCLFADLRQPSPIADFSAVRSLADLSQDHCRWLAGQQGFAGHFTFDGRHFEWMRSIDFQPKSPRADAGSLHWEAGVLVERGRDIDYREHWHRDCAASLEPSAAVALQDTHVGTRAILLRVGDAFMFARDRARPLPPRSTLSECVAAAPTLQEAAAMLDCEISFGAAARDGFRITASTLPFRIGDGLDLDGRWRIAEAEGDLDALSRPGAAALRAL